jgi:hypothetical protein
MFKLGVVGVCYFTSSTANNSVNKYGYERNSMHYTHWTNKIHKLCCFKCFAGRSSNFYKNIHQMEQVEVNKWPRLRSVAGGPHMQADRTQYGHMASLWPTVPTCRWASHTKVGQPYPLLPSPTWKQQAHVSLPCSLEREMCPWAISKYFGDWVPTQVLKCEYMPINEQSANKGLRYVSKS